MFFAFVCIILIVVSLVMPLENSVLALIAAGLFGIASELSDIYKHMTKKGDQNENTKK